MTPDVVAVLAAVPDGDPGGLLAPGVLGAHPPRVYAVPGTDPLWDQGSPGSSVRRERALPLWWEGALVPEGWWRAWSAWTRPAGRNAAPCDVHPSPGDVLALANELVHLGLASRVVRLARVDGRLVELEVTP